MTALTSALLLLWSLNAPVIANDFPPVPGQRHDIGGYQLHIHCIGEGEPTVIIDTGLGDDSSDWQFIHEQSSKLTRSCTYDRPGYGWSDFGPRPRNSRRIAYELGLLLQEASISPPYVLVGHSFGGFNMRVFASYHPNEIAGLVLVDASHEQQYERLNIKIPKRYRRSTIIIASHAKNDSKPQVLQDRAFRAASAEISSLYQSAMQVQRSQPIPTIPLIVISRGLAEWKGNIAAQQREKTWINLQQDLTRLSPISQHIFAHQSGHDIPQQQPEIIVEAISDVINLARAMSSL